MVNDEITRWRLRIHCPAGVTPGLHADTVDVATLGSGKIPFGTAGGYRLPSKWAWADSDALQ